MAKFQTTLHGDIQTVKARILDNVKRGDLSMMLVDEAEVIADDTRVQTFFLMKNASDNIEADALSLTLVAQGDVIEVIAMASGRSQVDDIVVDTSVRLMSIISGALEGLEPYR